MASALEAEASRLRKDHEGRLQALVEGLPEGVRGKPVPVYGYEPAEAICERAEPYDLLLVGTHGNTGLKHWMLGSVAERGVRKGTVPTLVLRA